MVEARGLSYARFRDGVVRGEVHDGNAFRRGGVAGARGPLRARRADVWRAGADAGSSRRGADCDARPHAGARRRRAGSRGRAAAARARRFPKCRARAFGHTGFTGTSLWIDPEREPIASC